MRTTLAVSAIALAIAISPAFAADPYASAKDPLPIAGVPANWTGFYFGGNAGYGQGIGSRDSTLTREYTFEDLNKDTHAIKETGLVSGSDPAGFLLGLQTGYRFQTGSFVIGAEFSFDGSNVSGSRDSVSKITATDNGKALDGYDRVGVTSHQQMDYLGSLTGVVGVSFGNWLPYFKGGLAFGQFQNSANFGNTSLVLARTTDETGWTVGGGLAYKVAPNWSIFAEYDYYGFGKTALNLEQSESILVGYTCRGGGTDCRHPNIANYKDTNIKYATTSVSNDLGVVKFGVNYELGGNNYVPLK